MAELNFGLLTPPGSESIGNAFVRGQDQALAAQQAQNQNAMAQYTLGKARRDDAQQTELYNAVRQPGFKLDIGTAMKFGAPGLAADKAQAEGDKAALDAEFTRGRIKAQPGEASFRAAQTQELKNKNTDKYILQVAGLPNVEAANAAIDNNVADGTLNQTTADSLRQGLTPETFKAWKHDLLMRLSTPAEQLKQSGVTNKDTDRGGFIERQSYDAQGNAIGAPVQLPKTAAPSTTAAMTSAQTGVDRLAFEREKAAYERANPGYTIQEGADGAVFGVDRRSLKAVPVTMGAPSVAVPAMGSGASMPAVGGGVPGPRVAPAAAPVAPAQQFMGAGKPLTESQGKSTAFGMRMKESDAILQKLAKEGTLRGANVESTPIIGESLGKVLPSFMGGTSAQQQQVNQAKRNFITAVLRQESGAAIADSEFATEDKKYFPQLNDSEAVIKQKANARNLAIKTMTAQAGPGAKSINEYKPSVSMGSAADPLGFR